MLAVIVWWVAEALCISSLLRQLTNAFLFRSEDQKAFSKDIYSRYLKGTLALTTCDGRLLKLRGRSSNTA
jgi:hypothetical protein